MSERHTSRRPSKAAGPDMRSEYDFSGAVRGKYYKRNVEGTNIVVLEPDVAKRFKTSESVNRALRTYLKAEKRGLTARFARAPRKRA